MMATALTNTRDIAASLVAITGPDHVRAIDGAIEISPSDTAQIAAILRFAHENHLPVAPSGGGTKQGWGNRAASVLVLKMHRLNQVREHTWQDMTCTVDAGCSWSSMQTALAQHRQQVALDPLWSDQATVGGVVATNDSGVLRLRYGGLRDLIIGMTIVLADGTVAHTGGKVVKNVAGYDLHKLMIGAYGTLGVVSSVNFRLHAISQCVRSFSVPAATAEPLAQLMLKLLHAQLSIVAIQLRSAGVGFALDVQLASLDEVLQAQENALETLAQREGFSVETAGDEVWQARERSFAHEIVCKATMLPAEVGRFAKRVRELGGESVTQATGIIFTGFPAGAQEHVLQLRQEVEGARGSVMVLKQPPETALDCWGSLPDSFSLMREVKRRFDPQNVLNPGRFLGGI